MAKTKYNENFPLLAEGYARKGMIDKEIAAALGISTYTFYQYLKKYPLFSQSIKRGKAPVDFEAENCLLKRVRGYEFEETTVEYDAVKKGQKVSPKKIKKVTKQMASDVTACIFWLKNRMPEAWRDKQDIDVGDNLKSILIKRIITDERPEE